MRARAPFDAVSRFENSDTLPLIWISHARQSRCPDMARLVLQDDGEWDEEDEEDALVLAAKVGRVLLKNKAELEAGMIWGGEGGGWGDGGGGGGGVFLSIREINI